MHCTYTNVDALSSVTMSMQTVDFATSRDVGSASQNPFGGAGKKGPQAEKQQRRAQAKEQRRLKASGKGDGSQPAKHKNTFMEVLS